MKNRRSQLACVLLGGILLGGFRQQGWSAQQPADDPQAAEMAALQKLNGVIGEWRGIAQPQRGSTRGAWSEAGEFVWDFTGEHPAVKYVVTDGKLVREARLTWNSSDRKYEFALTAPDGKVRKFAGEWSDNRLVLESPAAEGQEAARLTITPLNEKRTLVLHESAAGASFRRVAEVGYTREGTRLAISGGSGPECIVTGGTGTMAVAHNGETYYVCCTGCKQAFDDDPAAIVAAYRQKLKERLDGN